MRSKNQSNGIYRPIILGVVLALITAILLSALGAVFLDNESLQIGVIPYVTFVIWFATSFLGAFFSGRIGEGKWLLKSGVTVILYHIILLAVGIFLFDGVTGSVIYGLLCGLAGFLLEIFVMTRRGRMPGNRKFRNFKIK